MKTEIGQKKKGGEKITAIRITVENTPRSQHGYAPNYRRAPKSTPSRPFCARIASTRSVRKRPVRILASVFPMARQPS